MSWVPVSVYLLLAIKAEKTLDVSIVMYASMHLLLNMCMNPVCFAANLISFSFSWLSDLNVCIDMSPILPEGEDGGGGLNVWIPTGYWDSLYDTKCIGAHILHTKKSLNTHELMCTWIKDEWKGKENNYKKVVCCVKKQNGAK